MVFGICLSNINIIMQHRYRTSGFILKLHTDKVVPAVCSSHCLHITGHIKSTINILYFIYCYMLLYICVFALYWSSITSWLTLTLCQNFWSDKLLDPLCSSSWCRWRSFLGQLEMSLFPVLACWSHRTVPSQGCAAICLKVWERVGAEWRAEVGLTSTCCQDWAG